MILSEPRRGLYFQTDATRTSEGRRDRYFADRFGEPERRLCAVNGRSYDPDNDSLYRISRTCIILRADASYDHFVL